MAMLAMLFCWTTGRLQARQPSSFHPSIQERVVLLWNSMLFVEYMNRPSDCAISKCVKLSHVDQDVCVLRPFSSCIIPFFFIFPFRAHAHYLAMMAENKKLYNGNTKHSVYLALSS